MDKASPELEGYDEWIEGLFDKMPVEKKLLGIAPEQRLAGLAKIRARIGSPGPR